MDVLFPIRGAFTAFTRKHDNLILHETCDEEPLSGRGLALRTLNPETSLARPSTTDVWEPHHDAATASRRSPALKWHKALFPAPRGGEQVCQIWD